jgi:HipA-like protein
MKRVLKLARDWLGWRTEMVVPPGVKAEFSLYLDSLLVGTLVALDSKWQFVYSDQFKLKKELRPLVEFPDLDKIYVNEELWQFFASRIPSMEQPEVERLMAEGKIDDDDIIGLLRLFGKRTITNPFELRHDKALA